MSGEGVRGVGGVDEVAVEHDVVADAAEGDVVRGEGAEDGFEVVDVLGEGGVFEGGAEAGGVERDFDGGGVGGGEAEAGRRGRVGSRTRRQAQRGWGTRALVGAAKRSMVSAGGGSGSVSGSVGFGGDSLRRWRGRLRRWQTARPVGWLRWRSRCAGLRR